MTDDLDKIREEEGTCYQGIRHKWLGLAMTFSLTKAKGVKKLLRISKKSLLKSSIQSKKQRKEL